MESQTSYTMTPREMTREAVLRAVESGDMSTADAAQALELSERQVRRIRKRYREEGARGLIHRNRGRRSARRLGDEEVKRIVELVRERYRDYNDVHLSEVLAERHGIRVSRSTVRRIRMAHGLRSPRRRRAPRRYTRRERKTRRGELVQIDGSTHDWLEGRGPYLTLLAFVDDASGELLDARFREQEDAAGYVEGLRAIAAEHGLPVRLYSDRRNVFQDPKSKRSQFKDILQSCGVALSQASTPQAKGRVERVFGTLQDRLVKALREADATTLQEANAVLETYLPAYNARFARPPADPHSAFRPWPERLNPEEVFVFRHERKVLRDNTIAFDGHRLPIPPQPHRRVFAHADVEVRQHLDGSLSIHHDGHQLARYAPAHPGPVRLNHFTPADLPTPAPPPPPPDPPDPPPPRSPYVPPPDHPWRRYPKPSRPD